MKGLYEQTVLPIPFIILGKALKPFSFGHYIILRRFNVGFVSDKEERLTLEDLVFSIFVCSMTFDEAKELLYSGKWQEKVTSWGQLFTPFEKDGVNYVPKIDFETVTILFREYLAHHTVWPEYKKNKNGDSELEANAEWYEGVLKTLTQHCGYTRNEVLNLCFSEAVYEYLSYLEQQGVITFRSEQSITARKKLQEQLRKETEHGRQGNS